MSFIWQRSCGSSTGARRQIPGTRGYSGYTKHPDGVEMDCVFVPDKYRGKGYARYVVEELIKRCGSETIFIHSTIVLISFYKTFGFSPIPEDQLPKSIKERFLFCFGEMEGCNVCPMVRKGTEIR
jgi:N-acetylglutamate synthase-like GNAT family acetyltransferase